MSKKTTKTDTKPEPKQEIKAEEPKTTGHVNTTENIQEDSETPKERAALTDKDRSAIVDAFNASEKSVAEIAEEYSVEPAEVFALVDKANEGRKKD